MSRDEQMRRAVRLSTVGFEFLAVFCLLAGAGYWADGHFGTGPWLTASGAAAGLVAAAYHLIRRSLASQRRGGPIQPTAKRKDRT